MVDHFQLAGFRIKEAGSGNIAVMVSGERLYYQNLRLAFPQYRFSRAFDDQYGRFDWGTYINGIDESARLEVHKVLELFKATVYLDDALDQTFALDYHMRSSFHGGGRTEIGELVYGAKYHRDKTKALEIAKRMVIFIQSNPAYLRSEYIISVPSYAPKPFDLPAFLAGILCDQLHIPNGTEYVLKIRKTQPMKDVKSVKDKSDNIRGAFQVKDPMRFQNCVVTVIDDIYSSGTTLHELATELQQTGARVQGLVATKTLTDPQ